MKKIFAIIKISRPLNFIISFFSILVAAQICSVSAVLNLKIIAASFAGALTGSAGNIINDYFDIEIDKVNRPNRILPLKLLSQTEALNIYFIFIVISFLISFNINFSAFIIIIFASVIIFIYSLKLKKIPLLGNFSISVITGMAFIYGGFVVDNYADAIIPALFAFLINFSREIVKDMEDVVGDTKENVFTFPSKYGFKKSKNIILIISVILFLLSFIPFLFNFYKIYFFIIMMIIVNPVLVYFIKSIFKDDSKKNLSRLSLLLKIDMIFGLIAIYFGKWNYLIINLEAAK